MFSKHKMLPIREKLPGREFKKSERNYQENMRFCLRLKTMKMS